MRTILRYACGVSYKSVASLLSRSGLYRQVLVTKVEVSNEAERLDVLERYQIMDTDPEQAFEDITHLAAAMAGLPIAMISFVANNTVWFKSVVGVPLKQIDRCDSICAHLVETRVPFYVRDLTQDPRFEKNLFVMGPPFVRSYAAAPLITADDHVIGTLSVLGPQVYDFNDEHLRQLERFARLIIQLLEARLKEQAQLAMEKQKNFLNAVLENLDDTVVACDETGTITLISSQKSELMPADPAYDWRKEIKVYYADGKTQVPETQMPYLRALRGERILNEEIVVHSPEGIQKLVLCGRALLDSANQIKGAVITSHDVTEERRARAQVDAAAANLRQLIESCPVGILVLDCDTNITMWNPACEKIYGWKQDEVIGRRLPFMDPQHRQQGVQLLAEVRQNGRRGQIEGERFRKDGILVCVQISVIPLFNESNEIDGFMGLIIDISEAKSKERDLLEINRALRAATAAKSQFLANMSHEIRTPLNGIVGLSELMTDTPLNTEQAEYMDGILLSGRNLQDIVDNILDFSLSEAGQTKIQNSIFDFPDLLNSVHRKASDSAKAKNLQLNCFWLDDHLPVPVFGDVEHLSKVIDCLINNAIKFTQQGHVTTWAGMSQSENGLIQIRVEVRDSGIGIAKEHLAQLFDPFSQADASATRKFGGTGLGLTLAKSLMSLFNGEIGVESSLGIGSTFWFTLQLPSAAAAASLAVPQLKAS